MLGWRVILATSNQVNSADSALNNFRICLVRFGYGGTKASPDYLSRQQILAFCQRYYQKSYNQGLILELQPQLVLQLISMLY